MIALIIHQPTAISVQSALVCRSPIFVRRYASAVPTMAGVCLSVCLSQVGVLSKRLDESSWFLDCVLPSTYPILRSGNSGIYKNKG